MRRDYLIVSDLINKRECEKFAENIKPIGNSRHLRYYLSYLMTLILLILYNKKKRLYKFNYPHLCLTEKKNK